MSVCKHPILWLFSVSKCNIVLEEKHSHSRHLPGPLQWNTALLWELFSHGRNDQSQSLWLGWTQSLRPIKHEHMEPISKQLWLIWLMVIEDAVKMGGDFMKNKLHFTHHFSIWWSCKGEKIYNLTNKHLNTLLYNDYRRQLYGMMKSGKLDGF